MGIRSTLSSILSAPVAAVLEARVRELTDALLDELDLADPADVRRAAAGIDDARKAVDTLQADLAATRDAVSAMELEAEEDDDDLALRLAGVAATDDALRAELDRLQGTFDALARQVASLTEAVDAVRARTETAAELAGQAGTSAARTRKATTAKAKAAPKAKAAAKGKGASKAKAEAPAGDRGCKVEGCGNKHRARGFCGRHYQMWNRGTLPGFVGADGTVSFEDDDRVWKVADDALVGKAATLSRGRVRVGGKQVEATKQTD